MLQKITREPALIIGLVTATLGLAVAFGVQLTEEQSAAALLFIGALVALTRYLTTPASETLAQVKPNGVVVAGAASTLVTGQVIAVQDDTGYLDEAGEEYHTPAVTVPIPVDPDAP